MTDRYIAVLGPNSKQLWVCDETEGVYIDPPAEILDYIDEKWEDVDQAEELLMEFVKEEMNKPNNGWLGDKDYWYDGDI